MHLELNNMEIRTRFAPSPTGDLHVGGIRTALFNWAFAKKNDGKFLLRIENTDTERSTKEFSERILDGLNWLKIDYDDEPIYQSENFSRYQNVVKILQDNGFAYPCYCSIKELNKLREDQLKRGEKPRYNGICRPENLKKNNKISSSKIKPVIRFKNPLHGDVRWIDEIKGEIKVSNLELDDLVLLRSDGSPTYNLTVVVDDLDMKISHVIRGDDHINNTPRQINIIRALKGKVPIFGHLPMIHNEKGEKLSKRHGAPSILEFKKLGFIPEGIINYLARLGWGFKDMEIFSSQEFIKFFSLKGCSSSPSNFDLKKLHWVNHCHLKKINIKKLAIMVNSFLSSRNIETNSSISLLSLCETLKERTETVNELANECECFYKPTIYSVSEINSSNYFKKFKFEKDESLFYILSEFSNNLPEKWNLEKIQNVIQFTLNTYNLNMPQLAIPLRLALLGKPKSPAIDKVLLLLGKDAVFERIKLSLEK